MQTIYGLIPAGGKSTRMGRPKLALPMGGRSVLERSIEALRDFAQETLVVLGPHGKELEPLAAAAGARVLLLPAETPDMRASVQRGLLAIEERFHPADSDAVLLLPADLPALKPEMVRFLVDQSALHPEASIWTPTFEGRRGHPTLIGWRHASGIHALPLGVGLRDYFRTQTAQTVELPCPWPAIRLDMDTPEDYEQLLRLERAESENSNSSSSV
ncbi:MAG: nucleotidyltransferase family protein [Gemmataceae bacterium]|nr:nucleotidyltransferase family protein [Gemmataceae bacterium]MCI0742846.1 nucleotidyltransferase family protein [Gemmataceae bacterium]